MPVASRQTLDAQWLVDVAFSATSWWRGSSLPPTHLEMTLQQAAVYACYCLSQGRIIWDTGNVPSKLWRLISKHSVLRATGFKVVSE